MHGAVDIATFKAIFFIVLQLLTHAIPNLALQAMEKVPDVSRDSARCTWGQKKYPFRAEPPRSGHYRENPLPLTPDWHPKAYTPF